MRHPRHGHSAVAFGEKFIVVSGSRKEKDNSQVKCEMYNSDLDIWFDMPDLNVGRHYHSSCAFNDTMIYVFCGIANATRKYVNSIEKYDHNNRQKWQIIDINKNDFPERQGVGLCQKNNREILVFGGFSGKFKRDTLLFDITTNKMRKIGDMPNDCFSFQMPTAYDSTTDGIYTCDMQNRQVYRFNCSSQMWVQHMRISSSQ